MGFWPAQLFKGNIEREREERERERERRVKTRVNKLKERRLDSQAKAGVDEPITRNITALILKPCIRCGPFARGYPIFLFKNSRMGIGWKGR